MQKKPPSNLFSRSLSLLGLASKLAYKEATHRLSSPREEEQKNNSNLNNKVDQAKILVQHLSHLKGAAMKAGQLLSLDTSDFLPPEAIEILSQLQSKAEPIAQEEIIKILRKELGEVLFQQISNLSHEPIASASIGQVHTGLIKNKKVAIKIQYSGIAESIDSDLALLKSLAQTFLVMSGKKIDLKDTFIELRDVLKKETNYLHEMQQLQQFKINFANNDRYIIPETLPDFCSEKILIMSFEDGMPLREWMKRSSSLEARKYAAENFLDLFCIEFIQFGLVQTDPNFANYLIREGSDTSKPQIVLLDFGAALNYSEEFRRGYSRLLRLLNSNSTEKIFNSSVEFGLLDPRESKETQEAFKKMIQISFEPFDQNKQPFDFSDPDFEKRTREANFAFTKSLMYSPPPRQLLFLHRKLGGLFNLVKRLGVQIDLRPYWDKMTAL